jgi:dipeptidyl-peptidase 4
VNSAIGVAGPRYDPPDARHTPVTNGAAANSTLGTMTFPLQYARTRRFALGVPNRFTVSPDGARVLFLRTRGGTDPVGCLWSYDVATGTERLLVDPDTLDGTDAPVPVAERIRRERAREQSTGITGYATDEAVRLAVFALGGRLWRVDTGTGTVSGLPATAPVVDPRPDPSGSTVAYLCGGALRVVGVDGTGDRALAEPEGELVGYGLPEHVAAESMGRDRGFWWAPGGRRIVVARVDTSPVQVWYLANPAEPTAPPTAVRYPAAGTANADVSLWLLGLDGSRVEVAWDRAEDEYVVAVRWDPFALSVVVQNRAQDRMRILRVDPDSGHTAIHHEVTDDAWVTIVPGVPAHTADGALVCTADSGDTRQLTVGGETVTPQGLQVREVLDVDGDTVLFLASDEPTEVHLWTWSAARGPVRLTERPGVYSGRRAGGTTVVTARSLSYPGTRVGVHGAGEIASVAETPDITPRVELFEAGEHRLRTAVLFPTGHRPGDGPLPVLMDPYGGPAAQRVLAAQSAFLVSQWFADQGFAVVVADGRGTPGRGPDWERTVHGNRGDKPLEDQIVALHAAAHRYPDMDLSRVGIRGWSYGGYLAALAVLRRPDVFHAAVAGAPVTDQRLYDTHWQERFLGNPDRNPVAYEDGSLLRDAAALRRPLMLIHGLLDDNVHAAHTMRLSAALLAAGRPHTVLPLPRATHLTREDITANLLVLQAEYLKAVL